MNRHAASTLPSIESLPPDVQERLAEVLDQYLSGLGGDGSPSAENLIAEHPDLADMIRACLGSLDFLHQASATLRLPAAATYDTAPATAEENAKRLGDYTIVREIARGGMGIVYEAKQVSLDRRVALKVLPFAAVLDRRQIARFHNEARAAGQLHHPNIVPVFSVGCERGVHYYAMQYIEGQPLDVAIGELRQLAGHEPVQERAAPNQDAPDGKGNGRVAVEPHAMMGKSRVDGHRDDPQRPASNAPRSPESVAPVGAPRLHASTRKTFSTKDSLNSGDYFRSAARLGIQVAEALQHAHEYGVVHRDIKPSNLLLDEAGKVWITDFGLARFRADSSLTATGDVMGTLRYMSPEQAAGKSALIDQRTDVYSLGITVYELLTLHDAFDGDDRQQILSRVANEDPPAPRRLNRAIPIDLETIVLKAIDRSPGQRYATAGELAQDLRRFLEGKPVTARRPGWLDRTGKWARRHRVVVAAALVLMFMTLAGLAVSTMLIMRENAETKAALDLARENYRQAEQNRARAQEHFRQARQVVDRFGALHAERLKDVAGAELLRRALLSDTLNYYRDFVRHAGDDPTLQADLAVTYTKIGRVTEQIGDPQQALQAYGQARRILESLVADRPDQAQHVADLALCLNNIGLLLSKMGRTAEADETYQRAIAIQTQLVDDDPASARFRGDLALALSNLGLLQSQTARPGAAEQSYGAAIRIREQLMSESPDNAKYAGDLAIALNNLSFLHAKSDPTAAEEDCRRALIIQEELVQRYPLEPQYQSDLAVSFNNLGALQSHAGRKDEATKSYQRAIAIQEQLARKASHVIQFRRDLAVSHNNLGRVYSARQMADQARESFHRAREIFEDLVDDYPHELNYRSSLGGTLNNLAMVCEQFGQTDEALAYCQAAIKHQAFAYENARQVARFRDFLINHHVNYGRLLRATGRWAEAAETSLACKKLHPGDPDKLYRVAIELALAAGHVSANEADLTAEQSAAKQAYRDAAVATLEEAVAGGFDQVEKIQHDAGLDGLRQHPGFRRLLQKIPKSGDSTESQPVEIRESNDNQ